MEDKKRKKEDKRKRETCQKVAEQKNKEFAKPLSGQSSATLPSSSSASSSPGPPSSASSSPATATSQGGGNNAKRVAVANGQPLTSQSPVAPQPPQQQRYMPREVPPRFRCQQDQKVLLKRGQPPLSSMLLGGGTAGGGAGGDGGPNANFAATSDSTTGYVGPGSSSLPLTSSSIAAASSTSNYANSTWGVGSGSHSSFHGREKVIVDGSDLEEWPSIAGVDGGGASSRGGGGSSATGEDCGLANSSSIVSSGDQSSLTSTFPLPNECMQSGSVVWGSASQQGPTGGVVAVVAGSMLPPSLSKAPALTGNQDGFLGGSGGGTTGANFNPNANPSAWPALVQQDGTPGAASSDSGPATLHGPGPGGDGALPANSPLLRNPSLSVNQSNAHQHQLLHQMQSRAMMTGGGADWGVGKGVASQETGAGPKMLMGEGRETDCGGGNGGDNLLSQTSQTSSSSSWGSQPYPAANSKMGASRTDDWEGSGRVAAEGGGDGASGWGVYTGQGVSTKWGTGSGGNEPPTVSQGGWGGGGEWGGGGGAGGCNPAVEASEGGGCSSDSSSSGASNPTTSITTTRAWDNQKREIGGDGTVEGSEFGGGQGSGRGGGAGTSSSSGGGNSRPQRSQHQAGTNAEEALQNLLSRPDLDPRILSNSGWGQTQIKQNVAWDFEAPGGGSGSSSQSKNIHSPSMAPQYSGGATESLGGVSSFASPGQESNPGVPPLAVSSGEGWESSSTSSSSGASLPSRGNNARHLGISQPGTLSSGAGMGGPGIGTGHGKTTGGWGGMGHTEGQGKGWGNEEGSGEFRQQPAGTGGGGSWGGSQEEKGKVGWKEMGRDGGWSSQKSGGGEDRGKREPKSIIGGAGWGDETRGGRGNPIGDSEVGNWGSWEEGAQSRAWGDDGNGGGGDKPHQGWGVGGAGGKMHPSQMSNTKTTSIKGPQAPPQLQSQPQPTLQDQGAMQGGWGGCQPPLPVQNQSSGWTTAPVPSGSGGGAAEPSGWEEPSPQTISRKMEIDDGTSAWGDPNHYNFKPVNLWDKSSSDGNAHSGKRAPVHGQGQPPQQQGPPVMQQPSGVGGGRDVNPGHGPAQSGWGGGSPSSPSADDSTAAWGKPSDTPTFWGDPAESGKSSGWGNPSPNLIKPAGSKSMQDDGWGEGDGPVVVSRHSSCEEEEEGAGSVWSSAGSQGSSSSYNSGGWGQGHGGGKKTCSKGPLKSGESWMNPMTRQFSNMGLLGVESSGRPLDLAPGPQDKKTDGEKRGIGLNEYNGEMRKGGRGGGGIVFRSPGSKDMGAGDTGPYYDKTLPFTNQDGCLVEEGPCSSYSPPTVCKPYPLYSHTIPPRQSGHHMFGGGGGGMGQSRNQPGVPPLNLSPGIRAQVPQQFLSPQVPGSVLKQMPPPSGSVGGVVGVGGVGGGVFPPQLSSQHIAMLSSIYPPQLQFQLACQLLLQQQPQQQQLLQNQRKFPQNVRQQADPQQLARIMAVLQQQRQQQQTGGAGAGGKLSPSHLGGVGLKLPDSLVHLGVGGPGAEMQQRTHGGYSGYGSGMSLSGLELGGSAVGGPGGIKEMGGQQSRFKWMMEGHSPIPSPPESTLHKNGPITPMKMQGGSPYAQYDMLGGDGLPTQGEHWHRTPRNKMNSKPSTSSWPPEFQPGVPWKGIPSVDPESDPYMTPGSMMGNSGPCSLNDSEHQLLRDNTDSTPPLNTLLPSHGAWPYSASDSLITNAHNSAKYTEYKTSWPPEPIGHNKMWKANRNSHMSQLPRPPPGLANQKQPSPSPWSGGAPRSVPGRSWGGAGGSQETRYGPGAAWSDGGTSRGSCWLVLSNLTPQIDGSTLRTICMQHGPLLTFHLGLTQGSALIRYSSRQEAAKAQSALHMCVLGNTTILAEFVSEEEVARYFAHSQAGGGGTTGGGVAGAPGGAGGQGSSGTGPAMGANSSRGGNLPERERDRDRPRGVGEGGSAPGGNGNGGGGMSGTSSSGWQSLDSTAGSPEPSSSQGQGLGVFAQWSSNGAEGAGVGAMEPRRQGLWGGMGGGGYPGSSLWGSTGLDERHQMGSPAALLPGDLLGGGTD